MTKVNKQFIEKMQERLNEKEAEFTGELNYKNMALETLWYRAMESAKLLDITLAPDKDDVLARRVFREETRKELVDMGNFLWMLWERLGDDKAVIEDE